MKAEIINWKVYVIVATFLLSSITPALVMQNFAQEPYTPLDTIYEPASEVWLWEESPFNPIFGGVRGDGPAYYPYVLKDADNFSGHGISSRYKMYYDATGGVSKVTYSANGMNWTGTTTLAGVTNVAHPIVTYNPDGWDGYYYRLDWIDSGSAGGTTDITKMKYAWSTDGVNWTGTTGLQQSASSNDTRLCNVRNSYFYQTCGASQIIYNASGSNIGWSTLENKSDDVPWSYTWVMFFSDVKENTAPGTGIEHTSLAYSANGTYWIRYGSEPIVRATGVGWDSNYAYHMKICRQLGGLHGWYSGGSNYYDGIGLVHSDDGLTWVKDENNPMLHKNDGITWRSGRTYTPFVHENDDGLVEMWYTGQNGTTSSTRSIGYALDDDPFGDGDYPYILRPTADESIGWTPINGGDNCAEINETVADGSLTYIYADGGAGIAEDWWTFGSVPDNLYDLPIKNVTMHVVMSGNGTEGNNFRIMLASHGDHGSMVQSDNFEISAVFPDEWEEFTYTWDLDWWNNAWEFSALANGETDMGITTVTGGMYYCTQAYLEVAYENMSIYDTYIPYGFPPNTTQNFLATIVCSPYIVLTDVNIIITGPGEFSLNESMNYLYNDSGKYYYNFSRSYEEGQYNVSIWLKNDQGEQILSSTNQFFVLNCIDSGWVDTPIQRNIAKDLYGNIYVVYSKDNSIWVAQTNDNGSTWSRTLIAETPNKNYVYEYEPSIAISNANVVYISWTENDDLNYTYQIKSCYYDGNWSSPINETTTDYSPEHSSFVTFGEDNSTLIYGQYDSEYEIMAKSEYTGIPIQISTEGVPSMEPIVTVDSNGYIYVAWTAYDFGVGQTYIQYTYFDGFMWSSVYDVVPATSDYQTQASSITVGPDNTVYMAYVNYSTDTWDGWGDVITLSEDSWSEPTTVTNVNTVRTWITLSASADNHIYAFWTGTDIIGNGVLSNVYYDGSWGGVDLVLDEGSDHYQNVVSMSSVFPEYVPLGLPDTGFSLVIYSDIYEVLYYYQSSPPAYGDPTTFPDEKMSNPQYPDPFGWDVAWGESYDVGLYNYLGDDWLCDESGNVTDIHFWISTYEDMGPIPPYNITVGIFTNGFNSEPPFNSQPDMQVWEEEFAYGDYNISESYLGDEGWIIPYVGYEEHNHQYFWRIDITNITDPFYQENGTIYWLVVYIETFDTTQWGWKTTNNNFMDNAVWGYFDRGFVWSPLEDPLTNSSLDFAFVITGEPYEPPEPPEPQTTLYVDQQYNASTPGWGVTRFDKIQNAVNASISGNTTIWVNGEGDIYNENVLIDAKSINVYGNYTTTRPRINGQHAYKSTVEIMSDWVNFSGFYIYNNVGRTNNYHGIAVGKTQTRLESYYNVTISDCYITTATDGVLLRGGGYCTVESSEITSVDEGIWAMGNHHIIRGNYIHHTVYYGIDFYSISNSDIYQNRIQNCPHDGVRIQNPSNYNNIYENNITSNGLSAFGYGLYIQNGCHDNVIIHNNFVSNYNQATAGASYYNRWNYSYPSCGNYWSDHHAQDIYRGPLQNYPGSDNIVDSHSPSPYNISGGSNNQDFYPFYSPYNGTEPEWNEPAVISNEQPTNGSGGNFPNVSVDVTDVEGDWFNITIHGTYTDTLSLTYQTNGTFLTTNTELPSFETVYWYVNITDSENRWTNATYHFITGVLIVEPPSYFVADTINGSSIRLEWTHGINASNTVVRYSDVGYPANLTDGTFLCNTVDGAITVYDLVPKTAYYFSAWGYNETYDIYSTNYTTDLNTTGLSNIVYVDDNYNVSTPRWGKDRFANIPYAMNNVTAGGLVIIYNGTYKNTGAGAFPNPPGGTTNIRVTKNITLRGESQTSVIIDAQGMQNGIMVNCSTGTVIIEGLRVMNWTRRGIAQYKEWRPVIIRNNTVVGPNVATGAGNCITFSGNNSLVEYNTCYGTTIANGGSGILCYSASYSLIRYNYVRNKVVADNGIVVCAYYYTLPTYNWNQYGMWNSVEYNTIENVSQSGILIAGWVSNITVQHNIIRNCSKGVDVWMYFGSDTTLFKKPRDIRVHANNITLSKQNGINVLNTLSNVVIDNNNISFSNWSGIYLQTTGASVINNIVTNNTRQGIESYSPNNLIYNNIFNNTKNANEVAFTEYVGSPLYGQTFGNGTAYYPCILTDELHFSGHGNNSHWKMWYDDGANHVTQLVSSDGITWVSKYICTGLAGTVQHPKVVYDANGFGGTSYYYRLFYTTNSGGSNLITSMKIMDSTDGLAWVNLRSMMQHATNASQKLCGNPSNTWSYQTGGASQVFYNASFTNTGNGTDTKSDDDPWSYQWVMIYDVAKTPAPYESSALAYSSNGTYWVRYGVGTASQTVNTTLVSYAGPANTGWDASYAYHLTIVPYDGKWIGFYSGGIGSLYHQGIGYAYSTDKLTWTKALGWIAHKSDGVTWRAGRTYNPTPVINEEGNINLYMTGDSVAGGGRDIGLFVQSNSYWNTTKTLGTNIINGPYLGGNYWSDYTGIDNDGDYLGDTELPYNSAGSTITLGGDYNPLTYFSTPSIVYVDNDYDENTSGWLYDHFDNIEDAIAAVNDNGEVYIYNGFYMENFYVNKTLAFIGEPGLQCIIDGSGGVAISLNANHCVFSNLTIQNSNVAVDFGYYAHNNTFKYNHFTDCDESIVLFDDFEAYDNLIYHNNFVNAMPIEESGGVRTVWNLSYPIGGNYYDYVPIVDSYKGADQDILGPDGINDSWCYIPGRDDNKDYYPLCRLWNITNNPPNTPINGQFLNKDTYIPYPMDYADVYPRLSIFVSDNDTDSMLVSFYWEGGTPIATIGSSSGVNATILLEDYTTWLVHDVDNSWYVTVEDPYGENATSSIFTVHTCKAWDINVDRRVNALDVSGLISHYREILVAGSKPWDINNDGRVNALDVSSLVSHYRETY